MLVKLININNMHHIIIIDNDHSNLNKDKIEKSNIDNESIDNESNWLDQVVNN